MTQPILGSIGDFGLVSLNFDGTNYSNSFCYFLYCLLLQVLIAFGVFVFRIQKRPAWSLHCKENAIAELGTVEMGCTFLRLQYKSVLITSER